MINYFPITFLLFYCLIYSIFIAYIISLNKMLIKIDIDIKSPPPRKLRYQKEKHTYISTNRRRGRYKWTARRKKRKSKRKGKKIKLNVLLKCWDGEHKWQLILNKDYSKDFTNERRKYPHYLVAACNKLVGIDIRKTLLGRLLH